MIKTDRLQQVVGYGAICLVNVLLAEILARLVWHNGFWIFTGTKFTAAVAVWSLAGTLMSFWYLQRESLKSSLE